MMEIQLQFAENVILPVTIFLLLPPSRALSVLLGRQDLPGLTGREPDPRRGRRSHSGGNGRDIEWHYAQEDAVPEQEQRQTQ